MKNAIRSILVLAATLLVGAAGCGSRYELRTPDGFARLDDHYDYRATSADGVVVAVHAEHNRPRSNLDFWAAAVDGRITQQGYTRTDAREVRTEAGLAGRQLRYDRTDAEGVPYRYWVTVFVTDDRVFCVEAGGYRQSFDRMEAAVDAAVRSLHRA